jgi:hypothetical protein
MRRRLPFLRDIAPVKRYLCRLGEVKDRGLGYEVTAQPKQVQRIEASDAGREIDPHTKPFGQLFLSSTG